MINELKTFSKDEMKVSVLLIDGKEYFPASEVASMLGYSNPRDAIIKHCRYVTKRDVPHLQNPNKVIEMNFIPEGDLYRLISRSKLPSAEKFESWVFDEVLPSVRKNGMYAMDELLENPDVLIKALENLKKERNRVKQLEGKIEQKDQVIGELKPKADYLDRILKSKGLVTISQIAKDYGMSAQVMNKKLHDLKIQYKQNGQWLLYSSYQSKGYTHTKQIDFQRNDGSLDSKPTTEWTQKGRLFIYEVLKKSDILPMIERTN